MKRKKNSRGGQIAADVILTAVLVALLWLVKTRLDRHPDVWNGGYSVHISELMTDNAGCPNEEGVVCDWVELANTSGSDFDLGGFFLSDEEGKGKYAFPAGTRIPAGGYLVVWCDPAREEGDYAPFGLKKEGGETVVLMNANRVALDKAATVACRPGQSLVRSSDGSLVPADAPSPGYPNDESGAAAWQAVLAERSGGSLVLSEIMSSNSLYPGPEGICCDWVEVYNPSDKPVPLAGYRLSDRTEKAKYDFPSDASLGGGEYLVIWCSTQARGSFAAPFGLSSSGGETVVLTAPNGVAVDSTELPSLEKNVSWALTPGGWIRSEQPTPGYANDPEGYALYRGSDRNLSAEVYITEIVSRNRGSLADEDGDLSDWIELANLGKESVALGGWYLSDSPDLPDKWTFPARDLAPGERLVIFASGKNRTSGALHASFSLSEGESVILSTPTGVSLRSADIRDLPEGCSLALGEDGQYRTEWYPTPGRPNTDADYEALCAGEERSSLLLIWEVCVDGADRDWVELKNVSASDIDLGDYCLTDNPDKSEKLQPLSGILGPGAFTVIPCEKFGLSQSADTVYLCRSGGALCDWAFLHDIPSGGSYGRKAGQNGYFYFVSATPGAENAKSWRMVARAPQADTAPGVYDEADSLTVTLSGSNIRYTTDGSTPTASSPVYTGPITVTETAVIRAACFPEGQLPGKDLVLSYFLRENSSLPIASLVTDSVNLFGPQGIYSNHENAWAQDWEREASLSLFEEDGSFTVDCGIQIHGRTSRRVSEKRSLKVKFRGRYDGDLNYDVFGDGKVTEFSSLLLRGSTEDTYTSYMRDELFADMAMDFTDVPAQNYRYVSLYINGQYWGIYSIREHHSEDYFASHYGVDPDTVQVFNGEYRYPGTFSDLLTYAENHYLGDPAAWEYIRQHLDVNEMIDWLILEIWGGDFDVYENVRFYSSPEYEDNRVLYGLVDMDLTMMWHDTFAVGFERWPQLHAVIPRGLLSNAEFKDAFLTRLGYLLQNEMSDAAIQQRIDSLRAIVEPESSRDLQRWSKSGDLFVIQMANLRDFTDGRARELVGAARGYFALNQEQAEHYFGELAK